MFHYQVGSLEEEPVLLAEHLLAQGHHRVSVLYDDTPVGTSYDLWFRRCIERAADPADATPAGPGTPSRDQQLTLPTVSINGADGTEIATALGTGLRFQRAGVEYFVVGSVTPAVAEAAARGL